MYRRYPYGLSSRLMVVRTTEKASFPEAYGRKPTRN